MLRNPTAAPVEIAAWRCTGDDPIDYELIDAAGKRVDLASRSSGRCATLCASRGIAATITAGGTAKLALPISGKLERNVDTCGTERAGATPRGTWTLVAHSPVGEVRAPITVR